MMISASDAQHSTPVPPPPEPDTDPDTDTDTDPDTDTKVATCFACHLTDTVLELRGHCFHCQEMFCNDCSLYDPDQRSDSGCPAYPDQPQALRTNSGPNPDEDAIYCHGCIQKYAIVIFAQDEDDH